jgi:hypothetical protein
MIRQWLEDRAIYSGKGHTSCSPALSDCLVDVVVLRTSAKAAMYGLSSWYERGDCRKHVLRMQAAASERPGQRSHGRQE